MEGYHLLLQMTQLALTDHLPFYLCWCTSAQAFHPEGLSLITSLEELVEDCSSGSEHLDFVLQIQLSFDSKEATALARMLQVFGQ